jgi:hypothetical protein
MIRLLEILISKYTTEERIFFRGMQHLGMLPKNFIQKS